MRTQMIETIGAWLAQEADHKARGGIARAEYVGTLRNHIGKLATQYPAEYDAAVDQRIAAGTHTHDETKPGERQ